MYYRIILAFVCLFAGACVKNNRVQTMAYLPNNMWHSSDIKTFEFYISDTSAQYDWLLLLQHTYDYDFSNIWLNVSTTFPNGKVAVQKQEIPLAFSDGRWMGRSVANQTIQEINMGPNASSLKFTQVGKYIIKYQQIMRQDPLLDVGAVGMAIVKTMR